MAAMIRWIQWTIDTHEMVDTTASALRTGCLKVMDVIPDHNVDIRSLDVDDVVRKYKIKHRGSMKDQTINTYEQRFRQTVAMYLKWLDGEPWQPVTRNRTSSKKSDTASKVSRKPAKDHGEDAQQHEPHQPGMIKYPFPIRPGLQGTITLPEDLTMREAKRIAAFVSTLALEDEPVAEPIRAIASGHFHEDE